MGARVCILRDPCDPRIRCICAAVSVSARCSLGGILRMCYTVIRGRGASWHSTRWTPSWTTRVAHLPPKKADRWAAATCAGVLHLPPSFAARQRRVRLQCRGRAAALLHLVSATATRAMLASRNSRGSQRIERVCPSPGFRAAGAQAHAQPWRRVVLALVPEAIVVN